MEKRRRGGNKNKEMPRKLKQRKQTMEEAKKTKKGSYRTKKIRKMQKTWAKLAWQKFALYVLKLLVQMQHMDYGVK